MLGLDGSLLRHKGTLTNVKVMKVVVSFLGKQTLLNVLLDSHLLVEVSQQLFFLLLFGEDLLHDHLICFLWAKVSFVKLFVKHLLKPLFLAVILDLKV